MFSPQIFLLFHYPPFQTINSSNQERGRPRKNPLSYSGDSLNEISSPRTPQLLTTSFSIKKEEKQGKTSFIDSDSKESTDSLNNIGLTPSNSMSFVQYSWLPQVINFH